MCPGLHAPQPRPGAPSLSRQPGSWREGPPSVAELGISLPVRWWLSCFLAPENTQARSEIPAGWAGGAGRWVCFLEDANQGMGNGGPFCPPRPRPILSPLSSGPGEHPSPCPNR